jgi:hypothetical protein
VDYRFLKYFISEYERRGACDSRPHEVTMKFDDGSGKVLELRVCSVKSTGDNCLINSMQQAKGVNDKAFRANKVREELAIPTGAIGPEWCDRIGERLGVTYALFEVKENALIPIAESKTQSDKHVNLLLIDGHYWKIQSDVRVLLDKQIKDSLQVQEKTEVCDQVCDRVVTFDSGVEEQDLECVAFAETLENPSLEQFVEVVKAKKNVLLVGAGGCGKTWLLKKIGSVNGLKYTATTACAADLLGGCTVQSYILKNRKPSREVLVVDEVSMMGSILFEQVYEWANKGKKADHAQLILSGDFLQLPPVNDRFFF